MSSLDEMIPNVDIPEGTAGPWEVKRFTVNEDEAKWYNLRSMISCEGSDRTISPGTYTKLTRNGNTIMSDTPAEKRDHYRAVQFARGACHINGLGLGMVVAAMFAHPKVTRVTVVELSEDVIALTGPTLMARYGENLEIIQGNALTYHPPRGLEFGCVWHDIWDDISEDNLPQMATLHRRYAKRCMWQGSWGKEIAQYMHRQSQAEERRWAPIRSLRRSGL